MKNSWILSAVIGLSAFQFACGTKTQTDVVHVHADQNMDAEQLAQATEQLVAPNTFMLADKVADMALSKDPNNKKAQFYKLFLQAPMALQGAVTRIRPFVARYGDMNQFQIWQKQIPNSPAKDFLYNGVEDLQTVTDVQNVLVQMRDRLNDFRTFLKQNPNINLVLYLNPWVFQAQIKEAMDNACTYSLGPDGSYNVDCDYTEIAQRKVNEADMIALEQVVTYAILYFTVNTSYSLEGLADLKKADSNNEMTDADRVNFLANYPAFGKLRPDHNLSLMTSFGADAVAAWKYLKQNQPVLCPPRQTPWDKERPGQLFENGLCTDPGPEAQRMVDLFEQALRGPISITANTRVGTHNFIFDPFKGSRSPIQDLRTFMPASFDNCGHASSFQDKTLGGLFPNGDADYTLNPRCP